MVDDYAYGGTKQFSDLLRYKCLYSGQGNILALNTVTNYGYKKGKPLFFGIFAGYYVVQILCAIFVYGVNSLLPNVMEVMKYIGAAYILWLAIHIAFSKKTSENTEQSASFLKGFSNLYLDWLGRTDSEVLSAAFPCY